MSSRLSTKPSRRDRPRSSDKLKAGRKRDGTPEKPVSPNQSQTEEDIVPVRKQVLDGEDIRALAIDHLELAKVRVPKPPSSAGCKEIISNKVTVRKLKPQAELDKPRSKQILIAKPAPPYAALKLEDSTGLVGPRFDRSGNIIPYSILGSVEDFRQEAANHGLFEQTKLEAIPKKPTTPRVKYEKKLKIEPKPRDSFLDENNALINWQSKLIDRKKQQGHISKLLEKSVSSLLMNLGDDYRKTQEDRYLIERSIPAVDYGRGYRIGSEFWSQQERIGDDLSGIHMTLTETERGYPPPIEHIGQPTAVKKEIGAQLDSSRPGTSINYPWHQSKYLKDRRQQLDNVMLNLDPHTPDLSKLQIIGRNNPYANQMDKHTSEDAKIPEMTSLKPNISKTTVRNDVTEEQTGPCLQLHSFTASWSGDSHSNKGFTAHVARVTFEVYAGEPITSYLNLVNKGTTTIYYDWKKIPKLNSFEGCASPKVQRFYFNTSSGVLLPGESLKFPFAFKSPNAGIFSETWQLDTRPVLCGGAALQVALRGIALQEDKNKRQRDQIEQNLFTKQAVMTARRILEDLIDGIRTPERPCSPVDAYITQEELFQQHNKGVYYSNEIVSQLNHLHSEQFDEDARPSHSWDLSIKTLRKDFLALENEGKREDLLTKMNAAITCLYFPPLNPIQQEMYRVGYQLLIKAVDNIVTQASLIRDHLGLPTKDVEMPDTDQILGANDHLRGGEIKKKKKEQKEEEVKKDGKKENKKGKKEEKDRPKSKGGKTKSRTATSPPAAREQKKGAEKKNLNTPVRSLTPPLETDDPLVNAKYRNKMYIQVYDLLSTTISNMTELFEGIQQKEGQQMVENTRYRYVQAV